MAFTDIRQWIEHTDNPRLIVLDTLAGVKPIRTQHGYTEDYESLAALHRLANEKGVSIIVLHHTRKMEAEDPVDTVSGTLGLAGCADSVLVLARSSQGTTLYVRGRDIEEAEHAVNFDKAGCRWTILGNAAEVHRSNERGRILTVLDDASEPMGPSDIAAAAEYAESTTPSSSCTRWPPTARSRRWGAGCMCILATPRNRRLQTPDNLDNQVTNAENIR